MVKLPPVTVALDSLAAHGVEYDVYDQTRVEPTDKSFQQAIEFAKSKPFDGFIAIGGGSVLDTAKAANLCMPSVSLSSKNINAVCRRYRLYAPRL